MLTVKPPLATLATQCVACGTVATVASGYFLEMQNLLPNPGARASELLYLNLPCKEIPEMW